MSKKATLFIAFPLPVHHAFSDCRFTYGRLRSRHNNNRSYVLCRRFLILVLGLTRQPVIAATLGMGGTLTSFMALVIGARELSADLGTFEILACRSLLGLSPTYPRGLPPWPNLSAIVLPVR